MNSSLAAANASLERKTCHGETLSDHKHKKKKQQATHTNNRTELLPNQEDFVREHPVSIVCALVSAHPYESQFESRGAQVCSSTRSMCYLRLLQRDGFVQLPRKHEFSSAR
jgi:hypothetical protein